MKGRSGIFSDLISLSRYPDWWLYKVSYLFIPFYALLPVLGLSVAEAFRIFFGLLGYFFFTASFGHFINDLGDRKADEKAGRRNVAAGLSSCQSVLIGGLLLLASIPFLFLASAALVIWALVILEIVLFLAYSLRPLRLKESTVGLFVDSLYAHVIPFSIGCLLPLCVSSSATGNTIWPVFSFAVAWQFIAGLRSILRHEIGDYENDLKAGCRTAVVRLGLPLALRIQPILLGSEILFFLLALGAASFPPLLLWPALIIAVIHLSTKSILTHRFSRNLSGTELLALAEPALETQYRKWLPWAVLITSAFLAPTGWIFVILHFLLFNRREFIRVPRAKVTWQLIDSVDGEKAQKKIKAEGCYLTSLLTARNDLQLVLYTKIGEKIVWPQISYGPNQFSDFYNKRFRLTEPPVCFNLEAPIPPRPDRRVPFRIVLRFDPTEETATIHQSIIRLPGAD